MSLRGYLRLRLAAAVMGLLAMATQVHAEAAKPRPADRVATVNGSPIDRDEFDAEVLQVQRSILGLGRPLACEQVESVRKEVVEAMIRREVLFQEGRKAGVKPDQEAINKEIKALRQQFPNEAEYRNELGRRNVTEETLRARMERNSSVQQYIERQFAAKIKVADREMVDYYEGHLDLFKQPFQTNVSHIFIQSDPKWEDSRKQEARRRAEQVQKDLKKGQDFAALARAQSDGPTRTSGGELGYIKAGQLERQFENAVFALKPGETTDLIKTDYGFHIFKVTDKRQETVLAYEDVKNRIRQFLTEEKARQEADLYAKSLREKAAVEVFLK